MNNKEIETVIKLNNKGFNSKQIIDIVEAVFKERQNYKMPIRVINEPRYKVKRQHKGVTRAGIETRRNRIIRYLEQNGGATVKELILAGISDNKKTCYNDIVRIAEKHPHINLSKTKSGGQQLYTFEKVKRYF